MRKNPGRTITIRQVGRIFVKSYFTNAINGFKKIIIYSLDTNIFLKETFAGCRPVDREVVDDATKAVDTVASLSN